MSSENATLQRLIRQRRLFQVLDSLQTKYKKAIISNADRNLINDISEGILNILKGNLPLSEQDKIKLKKYRLTLRRLVSKGNLKVKRKLLVQRGGGILGVLIPPLIAGISSIISAIASRNKNS